MYKFYIKGQKIVAEVPTSVSDTIDWLTAEFKFSDDWQGLDKWAHFKNGTTTYDINLVEDKITADMHLNLGAGLWKVYLHGNAYDGDDVVQRAVTDSCMIRVKQADTLSGQPLPTVPPSATEQILAKVSNASNKADAAALSASSAQASAASAQTSASQAAASASGKYTKPSGGIPKTDLASAVQTSLEKAESALQEHQSLSAYRTASDQDEIDNGIAEDINELVDTVEIIDESKYEKPQGGIPSTDMSEAVQTSLGKADTALQEHQSLSAYRTSAEQDLLDADKVSDIKINGNSIVTDGIGNIPMATQAEAGVFKPYNGNSTYGLSVDVNRGVFINKAVDGDINSRVNGYKPIVPANLDYAVKSAMCDGRGADWSEVEQKACRKRIGEDKYELIETITVNENTELIQRTNETDGTPYKFKHVIVYSECGINQVNSTTTGLIEVLTDRQTSIMTFISGYSNSSAKRYSMCTFDIRFGRIFCEYPQQAQAGTTYASTKYSRINSYGYYEAEYISTIKIKRNLSAEVIPAGTTIKIYAIRA